MSAFHDDRKAREDNRNWFARYRDRDEHVRRAETLDALWRRRLAACLSTDMRPADDFEGCVD